MKFVAKKGSKYSDVASRIVNYLCDKDEHAYSTRFAIIHKIVVYKSSFFQIQESVIKERVKSE